MSALKRTILSMIGNKILTSARIAEVTKVSDHFRFIEIESETFKSLQWRPGEKVQINVGDWNLRTYTPFSLNNELGRLGILAHMHGKGPGSTWAGQVHAGDTCQLLGPHRSLDFSNKDADSLVFFGDETALAVATTLKRAFAYGKSTKFIFESSSPKELRVVADSLGLKNVEILPKFGGSVSDQVLPSMLDAVRGRESCQVVLAGRAQSIHSLRMQLKLSDVPMSQVKTKAYWSEGRAGLD